MRALPTDICHHVGWSGHGEMTGRISRCADGFFWSEVATSPIGKNRRGSGGPGAGGALGFADPEVKISFACSPTVMRGCIGDRCAALVSALDV